MKTHIAACSCLLSALLALSLHAADPKPEAKPDAPAPPPLPKNELPVLGADLFDGFEGPDSTVWAFDSADDEAIGQYVEEGATQGKRALKVTLPGKGKKGKIHLRREVSADLWDADGLLIDITSPAPKLSVALALRCDPGDIYQESSPVTLKTGLNKDVHFSLDAETWKNEKSGWQYTGAPVNLRRVTRIILLLFTGDEKDGAFIIDNLRVEGSKYKNTGSASSVYRSWRPEFERTPLPPRTAALYQGLQIPLIFRASYGDIFDRNEISCGITVTTPSNRVLDIRGFYAGALERRDAKVKPDDRALVPPWGPFAPPPTPVKSKDDAANAQGGDPAAPAEQDLNAVVPVWMARFTPQETGRFTFVYYVRNSVGEARSAEFETLVTADGTLPPGRRGGNVRICPRDPRQLELSDGTPFLSVGQNVCWSQNFTPYMDKIKAYGGNTCRIWLCPWGVALEKKTDPGSYDLNEARRLDALVEKAEETGVRLIFCFTFHGMTRDFWGDSPYNLANTGPCARAQDFFTDRAARNQFKRLLAYATARWGSSPAILCWELINEANIAGFDSEEDVVNWTHDVAGYLSAVDPHRHLITTSVTQPGFRPDMWQDRNLDLISIHMYGTDVGGVVYRALSPFTLTKKPVMLAEFGGGWRAQDDLPDKDGVRLRAALWLTACSNACGEALPWWWDTYIETRNLYPVMAAAARFLEGEDRRERFGELVKKSYPDGLEVSGAMDNQGARLFVYRPDFLKVPESRGEGAITASAAPLELSGLNDGDYRVEFWDAAEGKAFSSVDAAAQGGHLTLQLPAHKGEFAIKINRKDWARPGLK